VTAGGTATAPPPPRARSPRARTRTGAGRPPRVPAAESPREAGSAFPPPPPGRPPPRPPPDDATMGGSTRAIGGGAGAQRRRRRRRRPRRTAAGPCVGTFVGVQPPPPNRQSKRPRMTDRATETAHTFRQTPTVKVSGGQSRVRTAPERSTPHTAPSCEKTPTHSPRSTPQARALAHTARSRAHTQPRTSAALHARARHAQHARAQTRHGCRHARSSRTDTRAARTRARAQTDTRAERVPKEKPPMPVKTNQEPTTPPRGPPALTTQQTLQLSRHLINLCVRSRGGGTGPHQMSLERAARPLAVSPLTAHPRTTWNVNASDAVVTSTARTPP